MRRRAPSLFAFALAFAVTGCASDSPTGPDALGDVFMTATIDGTPWTATIGFTAANNAGILAFAGSDPSQRTLGVGLTPVDGTGTYAVGINQPTNANYSEGGGTNWNAITSTGSGSVTLTELSDTGASGTFSFTLKSDSGGPDRVVTDGKFSVTF
jgi:hypothetical protein